MQINAEKSPFLAERLRIFMLPTVTLVRDGQARLAALSSIAAVSAYAPHPPAVNVDALLRVGVHVTRTVGERARAVSARWSTTS